VNDPNDALSWLDGLGDHHLSGGLWNHEDLAVTGDPPAADLAGGLTSGGYIWAALKRRAWLWLVTALIGLVIGSGLYVKFPPAYHAYTEVLLIDNPTQDPAVEVQTDQSLAQSLPVAATALQQLGLRQSAASLEAATTVTPLTDQVLDINVGAPSSSLAVREAAALAAAFLQYRADYTEVQQQLLVANLNQQFSAAQQSLQSINAEISKLPPAAGSSALTVKYDNLTDQRDTQAQIEVYATDTKETTRTDTNEMVKGSKVLDAATAIPRSHLKNTALYILGGLLGGLAAGMGIVIIAALVSDRLRRRDDVADALGAPVRLSVGPLRSSPWRPAFGRGRAARDRDMKRVVAYLRNAVPRSSQGPACLAVVAVDNAPIVAQAIVSLATSCAREGKRLVVADLAGGVLARRLRVKAPGVHTVGMDAEHLIAAVPSPDDFAPAGPLHPSPERAESPAALLAAYGSADLLVSLATLDPSFSADYLGTWATNAVAVVTAGLSSETRIRGVGEMVRLSGARLDSVVLLGADKGDESLGLTPATEQPVQVISNGAGPVRSSVE
jgi:capsular polysaccharide biosynthesis protein